MHARATHSPSASVEAEEGNPNSESSRKSKDRMSEEKKKRKKSSGVNTQEDTDANGELDSLAAANQRQTKRLLLLLHRLRRNHP